MKDAANSLKWLLVPVLFNLAYILVLLGICNLITKLCFGPSIPPPPHSTPNPDNSINTIDILKYRYTY